MTTSRRPQAVAPAFALLLLSGCAGSGNAGPAPPSVPVPITSQPATVEVVPGEGTFVQAEDADRSDADSTAEVAALMLHSWDTLTDRTQTAAAVRATPLMSDDWAARQLEPERNGAQGSWLEPGQHQAYSSPSIISAAGDVNRDVAEDRAIRAYYASWRWIGRDGAELPSSGREIVTIYLEKHGGRWHVVGHHLQVPTP